MLFCLEPKDMILSGEGVLIDKVNRLSFCYHTTLLILEHVSTIIYFTRNVEAVDTLKADFKEVIPEFREITKQQGNDGCSSSSLLDDKVEVIGDFLNPLGDN